MKSSLSSREQATKFVTIVVSSYPPYQRQADHDFYLASLIEVCTGVPLPALEAMAHPRTGLTRRLKWLPSVNEVMDFLEGWQRKFSVTEGAPLQPEYKEKFYDRNGRELKGHVYQEPITPEERAAHADKLAALANTLREAARSTQRASSKLEPPKQIQDPKALMASLANLEATKGEKINRKSEDEAA